MGSPLGIPGLNQPDEIGRGGFGTVYRVEEPEFDRQVAVKIIQDRVDDEEMRRAFVRECQAMGRLSGHPNIVTVHRGGTTELGEPYIVMDLMVGGSLDDRLAGGGPLPWTEVLEIGVQIGGALETAHRAGILHLDIKPANVLMSRFGEPKLADFGISRLPGVTATTDGRIRASIPYAAPERLLDGTAIAASDLYSLGCTLFTLLTGTPAFGTRSGEDLIVAISRIVRQPVPELRGSGVPDELARVIEGLMAKSPVDRFATAADAVHALQGAQQALGRPITRAVMDGPAHARGHPRAWSSPVEPELADPALTRPRYVPQQRMSQERISEAAAITAAQPVVLPGLPDRPSTPVAWLPSRAEPMADRTTIDRTPPDLLAPPPDHSTITARPRRATRLVVAVVGVVLTLAAGAALALGRGVLGPIGGPGPSGSTQPTSTTSATSTLTSPTAGVGSTTPAAPQQLPVATSVTHPDRDAIAARLGGYFAAINDRRYSAAFTYFAPDSAVVRNGFPSFQRGNSTTAINDQQLVAIRDLARGVEGRVTYRSTQDAEFGPDGQTCTRWNLAYELTAPDGQIRKARLVTDPAPC